MQAAISILTAAAEAAERRAETMLSRGDEIEAVKAELLARESREAIATLQAVQRKDALLAHYRRFVGQLSKHRDKTLAWHKAMDWAPQDLLNAIASDLAEPEERKAFRADMR